jgi:Domain of unknown function (DUF5655)
LTEQMTPDEFFAGHPDALAVFEKVCEMVDRLGPFDVRVSKSQVAFSRRRGFAYLWMPGRYLHKPTAEVVLSFALGRLDESRRFKDRRDVGRPERPSGCIRGCDHELGVRAARSPRPFGYRTQREAKTAGSVEVWAARRSASGRVN